MLEVSKGALDNMSILFDRYNVRLYNFFLQQTRDAVTSEDLTQNVFERVIKYRDRYEQKSTFASWIFAIARNTHMDLYRKKRPHLPGDDQVMTIADRPHEATHDDAPLEQNQKLKIAMGQLSDEQRELLLLVKYEGLKYAEAAQVLDCSVSALKVRVHRTMKDLRTAFFKMN